MTLTIEQKQAIQRGEAVTTVIDGLPCVILNPDAYDGLKKVTEYDDSEWTDDELRQLANEAVEDLDQMEEIEP